MILPYELFPANGTLQHFAANLQSFDRAERSFDEATVPQASAPEADFANFPQGLIAPVGFET